MNTIKSNNQKSLIQHFKFKTVVTRNQYRVVIEVTGVVIIWNISNHPIEVKTPPGGKMGKVRGFQIDMEMVNYKT